MDRAEYCFNKYASASPSTKAEALKIFSDLLSSKTKEMENAHTIASKFFSGAEKEKELDTILSRIYSAPKERRHMLDGNSFETVAENYAANEKLFKPLSENIEYMEALNSIAKDDTVMRGMVEGKILEKLYKDSKYNKGWNKYKALAEDNPYATAGIAAGAGIGLGVGGTILAKNK